MSKPEKDNEIKKILNNGLLEQAPTGMIDRIMATIAVSPARRLRIKPVEPNSFYATFVPVLTVMLIAVAAFIKPESRFSFSLDQYLNLNINPIWITPFLVVLLTVWGYIFITRRKVFFD